MNVSSDPEFKNILKIAEKIANERMPVVLVGETGTGKTFLAKLIHQKSIFKNEPFISLRITDIAETLVESEILGVEKGVATGVLPKSGILETVGSGTISISGLEDVSFKTQALFLRVLETGEFEKIGNPRKIRFKGRIIAEFQTDPETLIRERRLRSDLYYRLNVFEIFLPPLRSRKNDILPFFKKFLKEELKKRKIKSFEIESDLIEFIKNYKWEGNLRELRNVAVYLSLKNETVLRKSHLPPNYLISIPHPVKSALEERLSLEQLKKAYIESVLQRCGGNKSQAAKWLKISRKNLWEQLKQK
ncbi:MAG: sigma 54-interacting transcriptional regulator [Acidobacteria bacterium]|nr:sigma 54-interacting transcriptional regulator [Acidobacteriota bacterium]